MAVIGIHCEFCDKIYPYRITGIDAIDDLTDEDIQYVINDFCTEHGREHFKVVMREIEEVLAGDADDPGDRGLRP